MFTHKSESARGL